MFVAQVILNVRKPSILIYRYGTPPGGIMKVERLARIIATAAIAATPALTVAAATAVPAATAATHAVAGSTSVIEIVARTVDYGTQGDSTNTGCSA
jgi:hypothetical protein